MQAKLPDINHALVTARNGVIRARDIDDPVKAEMHVRQMIALLPEEYKIEIDGVKYKQETRAARFYRCNACEREVSTDKVEAMDYYNDPVIRAITHKHEAKVWNCPKCHATNLLAETEDVLERRHDPEYLKVVPPMPKYTSVWGRMTYGHIWKGWLQNTMSELENQISLYRAEYASQGGDIEGEADSEAKEE